VLRKVVCGLPGVTDELILQYYKECDELLDNDAARKAWLAGHPTEERLATLALSGTVEDDTVRTFGGDYGDSKEASA